MQIQRRRDVAASWRAKRPRSPCCRARPAVRAQACSTSRVHGQNKCITTDMGGTSFEASVARRRPMINNDGEIARHKIALPMLDIHTIGAGGGSIGWLDQGGLLRMGPQSAGADPGPACYMKGGTLPASTDANLVLGYLDPEYFAGGKMPLDLAAARAAIEKHIAGPMGLSIEEAAAGMYRVVCNNMAQGVREVTIKRGFDPREFPFIAGRRRRTDPLLPDLQRARDSAADRAARIVGAVRDRHADVRPEARLRAHVRRAPAARSTGRGSRADRRHVARGRAPARRRAHRGGEAPLRGASSTAAT